MATSRRQWRGNLRNWSGRQRYISRTDETRHDSKFTNSPTDGNKARRNHDNPKRKST